MLNSVLKFVSFNIQFGLYIPDKKPLVAAKMPNRSVAFSGKKKKKQLQAKREKKQSELGEGDFSFSVPYCY